MLCPEEPKAVEDAVDIPSKLRSRRVRVRVRKVSGGHTEADLVVLIDLIKGFHGVLNRQHGRPLPSAEQSVASSPDRHGFVKIPSLTDFIVG
jgi:hypothetical protein